MTPPTGANRRTMTTVRPAPRLEPDPGNAGLATILAKIVYGGDHAQANLIHYEKIIRELSEKTRTQDEELRHLRTLTGDTHVGMTSLAEVLGALDKIGGYSPDALVTGGVYHVTAEQIARVILAVAETERTDSDLARVFDESIERSETLGSRLRVTRAAMIDEERFPPAAPKTPRRR